MKCRCLSSLTILILVGSWLLPITKALPEPASECAKADMYLSEEMYEQAETTYTDLLKNNLQLQCAKDGIKKIEKEASDLYKKGQKIEKEASALYEQGQKKVAIIKLENARQEYIKALKVNPKHKEARDSLESASSKNLEYLSGWEIVNFRDLQWSFYNLVNAIVCLVGLVAIILLLNLIYVWIQGARKPRLNIQDFDKGGTELEIGKALAAMVQEEFQNADSKEDSPGSIPKMTLVAAPLGKLELPEVKSLPTQLSIVSQLINLLPNLLSYLPWIYKNSFILSGYLHPSSERGVGITLTLKREKGELVGNCTIWQRDYDPNISITAKSDNAKDPSPYYYLVEPAAIWTLFQLDTPIDRLNVKSWSGVQNWQSYAYFRAGVYWRLKQENDKAKSMFNNALIEDINNRFALLNLGALDILEEQYDRAIGRTKIAQKMSNLKDIVWYKSSYQLAVTYLYKQKYERAKQEIQYLRKGIVFYRDRFNNKSFLNFLDNINPIVISVYAETLVREGKLTESTSEIQRIKDIPKQPYRVQYNLACYYSFLGEYYSRQLFSQAFFDFYCKISLFHLKNAFEQKSTLAKWAQKDPSLKGVRENSATQNKFEELIKNCDPQKIETPASKDPNSASNEVSMMTVVKHISMKT
jgi:tetratricopeptide (TPR) repeat protein